MISDAVEKRSNVCLSKRIALNSVKGRKPGVKRAIGRKLATLAIAVTAGILTIVPTAMAQVSMAPTDARSTTEATSQRSTCAAGTQGLMCQPSNRDLQIDTAPVQMPQASAVSLLQPLSNAQMERLSAILLGSLYFVLPAGLGVALFLHDRQQAQRAAALAAQIKLLEKLWEQSPQA